MIRIVALVAALAATPLSAQQLYKYVDKDGRTVYSDQPPANVESKSLGPAATRPQGTAPGAPKSAVERDKDLAKSRDEARDKQKKADEAAQKAQEAEQRCAQAKSMHQTYADGGRIHRYNDKGERVLLDDAEIEAGRERTRREMEEACRR